MDRYTRDIYINLILKTPSIFMAYFIDLPREMQLVIAMNYFENRKSNAWELKTNGSKVVIEVKAQEIWMEQESKISSLQWFHLHWLYDKPKVLIDCIEDVNMKFMGCSFTLTSVISNQVLSYLMPSFINDEIVYNYNSLFSNNYYVNNPINIIT